MYKILLVNYIFKKGIGKFATLIKMIYTRMVWAEIGDQEPVAGYKKKINL